MANIQSGKVPIITSFPDVLGETPVFANTRVPGGHLDVACAQASLERIGARSNPIRISETNHATIFSSVHEGRFL